MHRRRDELGHRRVSVTLALRNSDCIAVSQY